MTFNTPSKFMKHFIYLIIVLFMCQCRPKEKDSATQFPGKPEVPASIKKEHEYFLGKIHKMTLFNDSAGQIAIKLNELLQHHFKEEEDFVLPPLGLLSSLANGILPEQSKEIILLSEKLKSESSHIHAEHQMVRIFLNDLKEFSSSENLPEIIEFENELLKHANTEEEIFFPSAIVVGEYLKLKSGLKP